MDQFRDERRQRAHAQTFRQARRRRLGPRPAIHHATCPGKIMTEKMTHTPEQIEQELGHIASVAAVMVDGDLCRRIVTPRALEYMFKSDPHDRFLAGDNYDVNDAEFNSAKKTLIRLARLAPFA